MRISVICTTLNAKKFLPKAIESFLAQEYKNKELLIVDNISTDGTHEIIENYQKKHPKIIKWIKEKDKGIANGRNLAFKHVTGDLVGFLGADDFLHKDFFEEMFYYVEQNQQFDVIYFNSYEVGISNGFDHSASTQVTKRNLIKKCPIGSGESFYYRKEIFDKFKFNETNRSSMDYELNMALASSKKEDGSSYSFYPVNITAVFNGCTGQSMSFYESRRQRIESILVQLKYAEGFKEKFRIYWRGKKLIRKNLKCFLEVSKIFQ